MKSMSYMFTWQPIWMSKHCLLPWSSDWKCKT
jgi:hypothetical protein